MSDQLPEPLATEEELDDLERREKIRNRVLLGVIFVLGCLVALWVGTLITAEQETATKAEQKTEQVQVEKFNLAQQIAAACADPEGLDEETQRRLCADARTIVREGPQGAQGIPGLQGVQGIPGVPGVDGEDGKDGAKGDTGATGATGAPGADGQDGAEGPQGPPGADGAQGPAGPPGADGKDGAMGPQGPAGEDGEPPFSWVVYNEKGDVVEACSRSGSFNPDEPTYTCTRNNGPLP